MSSYSLNESTHKPVEGVEVRNITSESDIIVVKHTLFPKNYIKLL